MNILVQAPAPGSATERDLSTGLGMRALIEPGRRVKRNDNMPPRASRASRSSVRPGRQAARTWFLIRASMADMPRSRSGLTASPSPSAT